MSGIRRSNPLDSVLLDKEQIFIYSRLEIGINLIILNKTSRWLVFISESIALVSTLKVKKSNFI